MKKIGLILSIVLLLPLPSAADIVNGVFLPAGDLTIVVNTGAHDGLFHFALNVFDGNGKIIPTNSFDIQTINGTGSANLHLLIGSTGVYGISETLPNGLVSIASTCSGPEVNQNFGFVSTNAAAILYQDETATCTFNSKDPNLKTPVLIVPGILGTSLKDGDDLLWPNEKMTVLSDSFMDPLKFKSDLTASKTDVVFGLVIRKFPTLNYSDELINDLRSQGYSEGQNLFTFPYDWRYGVSGKDADGNEVNVQALKGQIDYILHQTDAGRNAGKVDVVAHSTGGLLVEQYVYEHQTDHHLGKVVMVGVPQLGAPKAFKVLIAGDNFDVPGLNPKEVKKISQNMPVVYDLAPDENYASSFLHINNDLAADDAQKSRDANYNESIAEFDRLGLINDTALAQSQTLKQHLDNFDLSRYVDLYSIVGCGTATFGQFTEDLDFKPPFFDFPKLAPGDGTVPQSSAEAGSAPLTHTYWLPKASHGQLMTQDGSRQKIVNIISGSKLDTGGILDADRVMADPSLCQLKDGHWLKIHSPVNITVTDQNGNLDTVLDNGSVENDIPGADYEIFGDHKYVYVPTDVGQNYTIHLAGAGTGEFTFQDQEIVNGEVASDQSYNNIPVTNNFLGDVRFEGSSVILDADYNGDGLSDQILTPDAPTPTVPETKLPDAPPPGSLAQVLIPPDPTAGKILGNSIIADGTLVLDKSDGRTVYIIGDDGKKFGFTSEQVFRKFGYDFTNLISTDLTEVSLGGLIENSQTVHPDGSLVRDSQDTIWFIKNSKRYGIRNMQKLTNYNFDLRNVVPMNSDDDRLPLDMSQF